MKNYYILAYDKSFIKDQLVIPSSDTNVWNTLKVSPSNFLSDAGMNYLFNINYTPWHEFNLFIGGPKLTCDIHIDISTNCYALNYVWGSSKSTMRWFMPKTNGQSKSTTANTPYVTFDNSEVELIEEADIPSNTLILVRNDIPHNVTNHTDNVRYCISARGGPTNSWENTVKLFEPYFSIK